MRREKRGRREGGRGVRGIEEERGEGGGRRKEGGRREGEGRREVGEGMEEGKKQQQKRVNKGV